MGELNYTQELRKEGHHVADAREDRTHVAPRAEIAEFGVAVEAADGEGARESKNPNAFSTGGGFNPGRMLRCSRAQACSRGCGRSTEWRGAVLTRRPPRSALRVWCCTILGGDTSEAGAPARNVHLQARWTSSRQQSPSRVLELSSFRCLNLQARRQRPSRAEVRNLNAVFRTSLSDCRWNHQVRGVSGAFPGQGSVM